ncbi:putative copper homeostasis (lipo)protein LpqS, partial [Nocardia gipuzkoensis]
ALSEPLLDHCEWHTVHCILATDPVMGGAPSMVHAFVLMLGAMIVGPVTSLLSVGVRGPPARVLPVPGGREILTRICIARR